MERDELPRILFASTNAGKLAEVRLVAARLDFQILSAQDFVATCGPAPEVREDANTYSGNAQLKADAFFAWAGLPSLADDAGLEVDALGGRPGVWSARYAGEPSDSQRNIDKMLGELAGQENRRARFVSFLFARLSSELDVSAQAELPGTVIAEQRGAGGFGYDSIFVPDGYAKTLAEIKADPILRSQFKTHRVMALEKILPQISRALAAAALRTER